MATASLFTACLHYTVSAWLHITSIQHVNHRVTSLMKQTEEMFCIVTQVREDHDGSAKMHLQTPQMSLWAFLATRSYFHKGVMEQSGAATVSFYMKSLRWQTAHLQQGNWLYCRWLCCWQNSCLTSVCWGIKEGDTKWTKISKITI